MESKINIVITALVFLSIGVYMLHISVEDFIIRKNGEKKVAQVVSLSTKCKKRGNEIKINFEDQKTAKIIINQTDCLASKYKVGDKIPCFVHPKYAQIVWKEKTVILQLYVSVIIILVAIVLLLYIFIKPRLQGRATHG